MILHWTNKNGFVADKHHSLGASICGIIHDNKRPNSLTMGSLELQWLKDNPKYLIELCTALSLEEEL
jgi:hypothetical protein